METSFLSFFVVKLKQIHIDKGITAGYSTNILQCEDQGPCPGPLALIPQGHCHRCPHKQGNTLVTYGNKKQEKNCGWKGISWEKVCKCIWSISVGKVNCDQLTFLGVTDPVLGAVLNNKYNAIILAIYEMIEINLKYM